MNSDTVSPDSYRRGKGRWYLSGLLLLLAVCGILPGGIWPQPREAGPVALQSDGKIVAVASGGFAVARYRSEGSLDASSDVGGEMAAALAEVTYVVKSHDEAHALTLQADGKIVVAGSSWSNVSRSHDFALARYRLDGSLDTSFGAGGRVTTDVASGYDQANAIALQADGKIVVAGFADSQYGSSPSQSTLALARYNPDGSLDASFGRGGKLITDTGVGGSYASAIALQSDGKIVVAGSSQSRFALARYNPDGSLDTSFGAGGKVTTRIGAGYLVH